MSSTSTLTGLLHASQRIFGDLLRQVCEVGGFTQGKLAREAQTKYAYLVQDGQILPNDPVGSLDQPTLARIMKGEESPTYYQVYIWIRVFKRHFASTEFAAICAGLGMERPTFEPEWEYYLWHLASFVPPEKFEQAYEHVKDVEIIKIAEEVS